MYGEDYSSHDAGQAQNADAGHYALYLLKVFSFTQKVVEGDPECNGNERHQQNILEHSPCINFNFCTSQPKYKQRCNEGRKAGADGCHTNAVCYIALAKKTHEVAANATWAATNENDACCHERIEIKNTCQHPRYDGHNGVLCHGSDKDVDRPG